MTYTMSRVTIYTDGACSGNPGPGGWGAILMHERGSKELSGYAEKTTNNRMELTAVIKALLALKRPCELDIYTDSAYVCNAFLRGWTLAWQENGWKTSKKGDVENQDLWKELIRLCANHKVRWHKVKGHADNEFNNRCDALARQAIKNALK